MRDEMDARLWAAHHEDFSRDVGSFVGALRDALARLNAIQFAAPWRRNARGRRIG